MMKLFKQFQTAALLLLQWNAQGMHSHGQELIKMLKDSRYIYHIICIQETWFKEDRILNIPDYICLNRFRKDKQRGGCAIYIHEKINYDSHVIDNSLELQKVCLHVGNQKITILNYYNPCKKLNKDILDRIFSQVTSENYSLVGDFNAHNPLWGSDNLDSNGKLVERALEEYNSVILNDGSGTRIDTHTGKISHLDLSITSPPLAPKCVWSSSPNNLGSDHFVIDIKLNLEITDHAVEKDTEEHFWSFKNFDWDKFKKICETKFDDSIKSPNTQIFYDNFMNTLKNSIKEIIPKKRNRKRNPLPWWTRECSKKIKERNIAKTKLRRSTSTRNLQDYKKKKAEAQKTLRRAENIYWTSFCQKIDRYTNESKLWACIRRMNGLPSKSKHIPLLKINGKDITSDSDKAEAFSENFLCTDGKGTGINPIESLDTELQFNSLQLTINEPFSLTELKKALGKSKPTAPGHDKIPYEIYSNLPENTKKILLSLINASWNTTHIPASCKHAILVPILKPNKDPHCTKSYRPIALLPCFMKIMERMMNERLQWFTEKHSILPPFISGFRQGRSATDNIVLLENTVQKTINNKGYTIVVFLDIAQAYDAVIIEGLLTKLSTRGIKGKMLKFLQNYLTDRTFQVRVRSQLSETKKLKKGLPQGSILSPLLFNLMMSDIPTNDHVGILTYADDIAIYMSGTNIKFIGKKIQDYLIQLDNWFDKWGLTLSTSKTVPMLFTKRCNPAFPIIKLKGIQLTFMDSHKFLGVTFDSKLQWHPHIENITKRCKRKLNFLRCLAGTSWGSSSKSLLLVYRSYIRSLLDYGCEAYDSAAESVKRPLDSIQYQALRICTGTLPLTPLVCLQAETGELPLDLRRQMLSAKFKLSIKRIQDHPILPHIQPCWQFEYLTDKSTNKPFGYRTMETDSDIEPLTPIPLP